MSSSPSNLPIGQVIGSRYRIQSLIGRGGMGMVYAATHELTGRRVALKLMISHGDDSPVVQERFLGEARIAAAVRHPHIVDVLDMGIYDAVPFIVMELLEGIPLETVLEKQTTLTAEQALTWLLPIMGALAFLHDADIVHRDVKPSNIFLSTLPRHPIRPKLLDFGLARSTTDLRLTRSGTVIGTPLYMAPEHAAGLPTGPQSDVWSIAVVLYEALAGVSPYTYTDRASLATQVMSGSVKPIRSRRPEIPEPLAAAIGRALQVDLGRRYPDMRSFARALYGAAVASNIPVPKDPDPIGLPQLTTFEAGRMEAAVTHDLPVRLGVAPTAGAPATPPARLNPPSQEVTLSDLRGTRISTGWWAALAIAVMLVVAGALWMQRKMRLEASTEPPRAATQAAPTNRAAPTKPAPSLPAGEDQVAEPTVESLDGQVKAPAPTPPAEAAPPAVPEQIAEPAPPAADPPASDPAPKRTPPPRRVEPRRVRPRVTAPRHTESPAAGTSASEGTTPRIDEVESEWK